LAPFSQNSACLRWPGVSGHAQPGQSNPLRWFSFASVRVVRTTPILLQPAPQRYQHRWHTCGIGLLMGDDDIGLVEVVPVSGFHLCQWPRAIHSARWGASAPMVVWSPWPVCTSVCSGRANSEPFIESMMVPKSLYDRPVAPGPPLNSVSPE